MRISIFTTDYPPMIGGIASYNIALAEALSSANEISSLQIFVFNQAETSIEERTKLKILRLYTPCLWRLWKEVSRRVQTSRPEEIIHATNLFPTGFFCVVASWWHHRICILSVYGTDILSTKGSFFTKFAKWTSIQLATGVLAFSSATAELAALKTGVQKSKFVVLSYPMPELNIAEHREAKRTFGLKEEDFVILFVGHLVRRKGCADLLRAVHHINDPRVKLIIVGYGPERNTLEQLTSELGITDRVVFVGNQDPQPIYYIAQVFSMPSYFDIVEGDVEGLGIVYLEAEQRGLPVLGTRSGGIPEAMEEGVTGFLIGEHDFKALAEKILYFKNNEKTRKEMGEKGKIFVQKKFGRTHVLKQYIDYYSSLSQKTC